MDQEFLEDVLRISGEEMSGAREILPDWYTEDEIREFLSDSIRSKIHSDGISNELQEIIAETATLPDDPDQPDNSNSPDGNSDSLDGDSDSSDEGPTVVRKYFDISKFVSFLRSGIWFSRLDLLDDNYEGRVPEEIIRDRMDTWEYTIDEEGPPFDVLDMFKAEDETVRKQSFVSCWRYGGEESSIFWEAYIGNQNGVAVETTLDKLEETVKDADEDVLMKKVNYKEYNGTRERFASGNVDRIFHKRFAFEDEKEVRLLARQKLNDFEVNWEGSNGFNLKIDADPGFNVEIYPCDLIEKVVLPPGVNEREIAEVVNLMDYHQISAEVWRSMLDVRPGSTAPIRPKGGHTGEVTRGDMKQERLIDKSKYVK